MKNYFLSVLLISLVGSLPAFAQFKSPSLKAVNTKRLQRSLAQVQLGKTLGTVPARVPKSVLPGKTVYLTPVAIPRTVTPANQAFLENLNNVFAQIKHLGYSKAQVSKLMAELWVSPTRHSPHNGKGFYDDQNELARALHSYYHGLGTLYISPAGRQVKLYALPADGILYQPVGYSRPLVLTAKDYFVVYDINEQTGQIAKNIPQVYNLFMPCRSTTLAQQLQAEYDKAELARQSGENEDLWQAIGGEKNYYNSETLLARDVTEFYYQKKRIESLRNSDIEGSLEALVESTPKQRAVYPIEAPHVRDIVHGEEGYIYEIPVSGVYYVDLRYNQAVELLPKQFAVFYVPAGHSSFIVERRVLEDPSMFQPIAEK